MSKTDRKNEEQAIAWVLSNTPATDEENAKWVIALWQAAGCRDCYDAKDWAQELLSGCFTLATACENLVSLAEEDEDELRESFADFF